MITTCATKDTCEHKQKSRLIWALQNQAMLRLFTGSCADSGSSRWPRMKPSRRKIDTERATKYQGISPWRLNSTSVLGQRLVNKDFVVEGFRCPLARKGETWNPTRENMKPLKIAGKTWNPSRENMKPLKIQGKHETLRGKTWNPLRDIHPFQLGPQLHAQLVCLFVCLLINTRD